MFMISGKQLGHPDIGFATLSFAQLNVGDDCSVALVAMAIGTMGRS
jgi:hypothetical protein